MNNYVDNHGRYHIKPVTGQDPYPTNNAYLYTFFAMIVGLKPQLSSTILEIFKNLDKEVLARHPGGYHVPISHDEYVGAAGLGAAKKICIFGRKNYWQFCDIRSFKAKPLYKLPWLKVIRQFKLLNQEYNPRRAVSRYKHTWNVAFRHAPQHVYFYKRCAGEKVSLIEKAYFLGASVSTIFKKDNSSTVMLGFKLLRLSLGKENWTEKIVQYVYDKKLDFTDECNKYFPEDHPIRIAVNTLLTK